MSRLYLCAASALVVLLIVFATTAKLRSHPYRRPITGAVFIRGRLTRLLFHVLDCGCGMGAAAKSGAVRMWRVIGLSIAWWWICCGTALAWNGFGHMEVAAIAWEALSPAARTQVIALLKLNPEYGIWVQGVAPSDQDKVAFMIASKWADAIKGDPQYRNDGAENGNRPPPGPQASQNIGYADMLRHRYWHFIDLPFSTDGTKLIEPVEPNAQTQIAMFRAALARNSGASDDVRSYDLVWLIHLVGDVHQPLHTTSRFTHDHPEGDAGGNLVPIHCPGCSADRVLHAFWDDVLGSTKASPQEAAKAAAQLPRADARLAEITDENVWIGESLEVAKVYVYASPPIGTGTEPSTLTDEYKGKALAVAKQRVALAGARLANLIEAALK